MLEPKSIDIGDIFRDLFRFTLKDYPVYLLVALFTIGPVTMAIQYYSAVMQTQVPDRSIFIPLGIAYLAAILAWAFAFAMISIVGHARMRGKPLPVGEAVGAAFRRLPRMLFVSIVYGLTIFVGMIACCVPGIFLATALYPLLPITAIEDHKIPDFFSRAWDLTDGNRWSVFAVVFLLGVINFALQIPFFGAAVALMSQPKTLAALMAVREILVTPFSIMSMTVVYLHLKRAVHDQDTEDVAEVFS